MIQGGELRRGRDAAGISVGRTLYDEINKSSPVYQRGYKSGTVAMANAAEHQCSHSLSCTSTIRYRLTIRFRPRPKSDVVDAIASSETDRMISDINRLDGESAIEGQTKIRRQREQDPEAFALTETAEHEAERREYFQEPVSFIPMTS